MDFVVLILPLILAIMMVAGLFCLCRKKARWMGLVLIVGALGVNWYTECIPLRWSVGEKDDRLREGEKGNFKILTYNIFTASEYFTSVRENPIELSEFLKAQGADVIVFEEYYGDRCIALRKLLEDVYPYMEYQRFHCSQAVYSKYPLSNWNEMVVNLEDNALDEYRFRRAKQLDDLRRMQPYRYNASVTVNLPGDSIRLVTCHLASTNFDQSRMIVGDSLSLGEKIKVYAKCLAAGFLEREVEAEYVMKEVKEYRSKGVKTIVLGDMNSVPGSQTLRILKRGGLLKNAWWEKGSGLGLTFHEHKVMHFRLDHIFHTEDLEIKNIRVIDADYSDHKPVVADFQLK